MKKLFAALALAALLPALAAQATDAAAPAATPAPEAAATPVPAATAAPAEAPAATPAATPAPAPVTQANAQTARYTVISELGQDNADTIAKTLEAYFDLYTSYFHFDAATLSSRLHVRSFATKAHFDAYLSQIIGGTKDDFVYLHYPTLEKCELLVYAKEDAEDYQLSLAHQAFVQYIKAFVPNAPLWLREGFAVYFEQCRMNPETGQAPFVENIAWLETVKAYKKESSLIPLSDFLAIDSDAAKADIDVYYPESWAFISFLLESDNKDVNRYLWDAIARLKPEMSADEAKAALVELASKWPGMKSLDAAFSKYLEGKQTFAEMVASGIELYNQKKYDDAAALFNKALTRNTTNHVPYYYLGLIAYAKKDYATAEFNYKQSLALGCEAGIGNYALGVNAFVAGRPDDAKTYLSLAKSSSPDVYGPKADEVLARIK